jgi:hypothetical protein
MIVLLQLTQPETQFAAAQRQGPLPQNHKLATPNSQNTPFLTIQIPRHAQLSLNNPPQSF